MKNLEMKARMPDPAGTLQLIEALGAIRQWRRSQRDTYFKAAQGKLKLREVEGEPAELIAYLRPDEPSARLSQYLIYPTTRPHDLRETLQHVLGLECVVQKIRTLYLYHNVRIHLDDVEQLGLFIEFEAVLDADSDLKAAHQRLRKLQEYLHIDEKDFIAEGYFDLMRTEVARNLPGAMHV